MDVDDGSKQQHSVDRSSRATTGITGLDMMLSGGLLKGGVYLLVGPPGAGKTVFANHVAFHHADGGGRVAYFTVFGETHTRLLGHIRQFSFFNQEFLGANVQYFSGYNDVREGGLPALWQTISAHIYEHNVTLLVVDGVPIDFPGPSTSMVPPVYDFYHNLQAMCETSGCTALVTVPHQEPLTDQHALLFVDGVFELTRSVQQAVVIRALEVRRFRGSPYRAASHPFTITEHGVTMLP